MDRDDPTPLKTPWIGSAESYRAGFNTYQFGETRVPAVCGTRLDVLLDGLKREFPKLRFQRKRDHWYWRVLHYLVMIVTLGGCKEFLTRITTTIGWTIAFPDSKWDSVTLAVDSSRLWCLIRHEREHLLQARTHTRIGMALLYLFVPLPFLCAWYRAKFERAGYFRTLEGWFLLDRAYAESTAARLWWIERFTTGAYGWMWIGRKRVARWFDEHLQKLRRGEIGA